MISIIVPIYNTSKYLCRCLDSLTSQSFKDIEIILVNDGSSDDSEIICKSYVKKYKNIKLFSKSNGGLSSARNLGIKKANGHLITFVDSDDWVDHDYCEKLNHYYSVFKTKIIVSDLFLASDNKVVVQNPDYPLFAKKYPSNDILKMLFQGFKIGSACGVLFEKNIFDFVTFKEGILDEDFEFSFRLYNLFSELVLVPYRGYYYDSRPGSITKSDFNEKKQVFVDNPFFAYKYLKQKSNDKHLIKLSKQFYIMRLHKTIRLICWSNHSKFKKLFRKNKKAMILTSFSIFSFKTIKLSSKFLLFLESYFPLIVSYILRKRATKGQINH